MAKNCINTMASYDALPGIENAEGKPVTSHPEFGHGTNGTEVAEAFTNSIRGKNSE